ncbi:ThiF family adenylyltransferase [Rothia sp. LK2588]|uniref:ThiF family adenylyltransferase n=1 Tax=Rothia sp. LK2588 TaxID=3114369 RepID=UPI0034CDFFAC
MELAPLTQPATNLTREDKTRYARHFTLPGIGPDGQARLANARVLSIGAGGLGSPALLYLAAAGVGTLGIIDDDTVDTSNLQRQIIHTNAAVGEPKTTSAATTLTAHNPHITIHTHTEKLTTDNATDIITAYDLVIDGSDNFATRYIVNDACEATNTPLIWGTISQYTAQVSLFWAHPTLTDGTTTTGPTLRDLYPDIPPADSIPTCAAAGVLGSLCGTIGSLIATEAIKLITGTPHTLLGTLWMYDARTHHTTTLTITPDPTRTPTPLTTTAVEITAAHHTQTEEPLHEISRETALNHPNDYYLIDVRQPEERATGHYPDQAHHPHNDLIHLITTGHTLTEIFPNLPADTTPLFYCASGIRSAKVVQQLAKTQPHQPAATLTGGYTP